MSQIDPRAIIDPSAVIGDDVVIGPWTLIGPDVKIGDGTVIHSHVVVRALTDIGKNNRIFQFSTIGEDTPDLKYKGEPTRLIIGDSNTIREGVTIHRGTVQDQGLTSIGSDNLLMAYVHIGHDSVVGNNCILVNNASLAGHVHVGDWAIISGYALIHQFVSVGAHSFIGAGAYLTQDIPAYVMAAGTPTVPKTINSEGLRRRGFDKDQIAAIKKAYKIIYRQGLPLEEALEQIQALAAEQPVVQVLVDSVRASKRGLQR
ncbi:acyl-ACP--UDP-N-acetylglucosamine O-acyltransferase [Porticoccus litoralis]|jgi:UDP-N-acetylglucosamine acyltransferase|uniref:Acyl-[acyl-carrier-protein]--UDP-N-acetylglucosamine O-acyltransferase n=1 Tax=Porticoccus litoralis TaxID=434086 RepID=A0AAW8B0Y6_9GAMM|nr:acyl-ACP--UDP-N-acetylglucosamine O-acyltransferase [Porticoccus litoralis]MDP1519491.1 acyl-ACP--UDP-N-acetylglucosamine O-acyltransferase [Porticoccus litoralis]TNE87336.1 MAG: acyl-ACP--UDP-N-acetylglucosamine O-acyltransferase [Gammaproteobacteria bacterium]